MAEAEQTRLKEIITKNDVEYTDLDTTFKLKLGELEDTEAELELKSGENNRLRK